MSSVSNLGIQGCSSTKLAEFMDEHPFLDLSWSETWVGTSSLFSILSASWAADRFLDNVGYCVAASSSRHVIVPLCHCVTVCCEILFLKKLRLGPGMIEVTFDAHLPESLESFNADFNIMNFADQACPICALPSDHLRRCSHGLGWLGQGKRLSSPPPSR